uniref:RAP domain-containing protein n=2 Tax=Anabas testudineus TaxID=64144 RepID=A0A3Q1ILS6_ANATE
MPIWGTEALMRWALRFCSRSFLWQQRLPVKRSSIKNKFLSCQQLGHIWDTRRGQLCLPESVVSSVRFYSRGVIYDDELEEKESFAPAGASLPAESQSKKYLFDDQLQHCCTPSDVLDLTCKYAPSTGQVSNCLNHMWSSIKKMSDEQRRCELQLMFEHPAFDKLLHKAMTSAQHMHNDNLVYSLLYMIKLGVAQESRVFHTFIRICQEKLNDFDEKCLSVLASCLEHMEANQSDELKHGIRLVVEARLPDIKTVLALQTMMRLMGKDAPIELKRKLERKALSMTDQFSLDPHYMMSTMATMGFYSKPLLDICSSNITENLLGIPFNRLLTVLQSCKELHYRDLNMFNSISDYIASTLDIWTRKQLLLILSVFEKLVFCPTALMSAFAEKVISNPDVLTLKDLQCVLKVYSSLNCDLQHHQQQFVDCLSNVLDSYVPKMSAFELLKSAYYLCLLGRFPSAPLEKLLQSSMLEQFNSTGSKFQHSHDRLLRTVDLCLRLDWPHLPRTLTVPSSALADAAPSSPSVNPWLLQGLQTVLGDQADEMLQESVLVENFYLIDAVITKQLPKQTEASSCTGEELFPAESSQRIAVIYAPPSNFGYGTSNPRGPLAVKIRHLKILGYTPVLVTKQELQSEEKQTDFFRGLIFPEQHRSETEGKLEKLGS